MSLSSEKIEGLKLTGTIKPEMLSPLTATIPINIPFTFSDVNNLKVVTGSYTPSNNSKILADNLGSICPNFILLLVDKPVVLTTQNVSGYYKCLVGLPVKKILFLVMPTLVGTGDPIKSIGLDGQLAADYPMEQGAEVNYTLIYGQADVT